MLGPSGCGKTTLLNMIGALDSPTEGRVVVAGQDITRRVAQGAVRVPPPRRELRVPDVQPLPRADGARERRVRRGRRRARRPDARSRREMLERVGLGDRLGHFPHELSGGEQQRVAIARALASGNPILLADEPTGELDFRTGVQILELLHAQAHTGRAVLVVTHNREIARVADRVVELSSGRVVRRRPARGRAGRDRRPAVVSDDPLAPSDGCGSAGRCATPAAHRLAGAVDRAAARARRRHVRGDEQHVDLARGLRRRELRRAADARPARSRSWRAARSPRGRCGRRSGRSATRATSRRPRSGSSSRRRSTPPPAAARSSCPGASSARPWAPRSTRCDARRGRLPATSRPAVRPSLWSTTSPTTTPCRRRARSTLAGGQRVAYTRPGAGARVLRRHRAGRGLRRRVGIRGRLRAAARRPRRSPASPGASTSSWCGCGPAPIPRSSSAQVSRALRAALPETGFTVTARADEPAHRMIYKDAEGDQQMLDIFAFLMLGAATFAAFNLISRTVEAQRREIGIGMALGVPPRDARAPPVPARRADRARRRAARRPRRPRRRRVARRGHGAVLPAAGRGVARFQTRRVRRRARRWGSCFRSLAAALPVWRAVRVPPIDAIRVGARAARSSGLAWLVKGLRMPGGALVQPAAAQRAAHPATHDHDAAGDRRRS